MIDLLAILLGTCLIAACLICLDRLLPGERP